MKILWLMALLFLAACSSNPKQPDGGASDGEEAQAAQYNNVDKFERYNRAMFKFNDTLDRWILKPVAKGYKKAVPGPVRTGVGNFFDNLSEIRNVFNDILQWKWRQAGIDTSRFLINTTIGIGGLFDVANKFGLKDTEGEDFAQTLAVWGVPRGSYIVLPLLGPSSVRGLGGAGVDNLLISPLQQLNDDQTFWALRATDVVHTRSELLGLESIAGDDFYAFVRDAYLQRREYLIKDGALEDSFGDDFDDEDEDDWGEEEGF